MQAFEFRLETVLKYQEKQKKLILGLRVLAEKVTDAFMMPTISTASPFFTRRLAYLARTSSGLGERCAPALFPV